MQRFVLFLPQRLIITSSLSLLLLLHILPIIILARNTQTIYLPSVSPGTRRFLLLHQYEPSLQPISSNSTPKPFQRAYIQAALHADEIPGLLVAHNLIKLLDEAEKRGEIQQRITVVPFANPIGLSQQILESHIGRFSFESADNFNRLFLDITNNVISKVNGHLLQYNADHNVRIIRDAMKEEIAKCTLYKEEEEMKRVLLLNAIDADIMIDLHCDSDAIVHMYTHDRLWPKMSDLAAEMGSHCQLLAPKAGGDPFDEACSCPWAEIADVYSEYSIPMACESATVELRGESDVSDELAHKDATALFRFLQRRGYIAGELLPLPALLRQGSPLTGVDMILAEKDGVVIWKVSPGDNVIAGQVIGEIIDIENVDTPRVQVVSRATGVLFGLKRHHLVRPGQVIAKVSGKDPLPWRLGGNLLTV